MRYQKLPYSLLNLLLISFYTAMVLLACRKPVKSEENSLSSIKYLQGGNTDKVNKVTATPDGGFLYCGYTGGGSTNTEAFLMKVDKNGNKKWYKTYGGIRYDEFKHAIQCSDGGYLAVGATKSFGAGILDTSFIQTDYIVKTNAQGIVEWQKSYITSVSKLEYVIETTTHDYVAVGYMFDKLSGNNNIAIINYSINGSLIKKKYFSDWPNFPPNKDKSSFNEYATFVKLAEDGNLIIAGTMDRSNFMNQVGYLINFTMKIDINNYYKVSYFYGYADFPRNFGYNSNYNLPEVKIINTTDGYFMATFYDKLDSNMRVQLLKLDLNGSILWQKQFAGLGNAILYDFIKNEDGTLMLVGGSGKENWDLGSPQGFPYLKTMLLKVDAEGNEIQITYTGSESAVTAGKCIIHNGDGWQVAGSTTLSNNGVDIMFVGQFNEKGILTIK